MSDKVLLLEKSEAISKNIFLTLQENNYEVLSTNSTTEGLNILSEYDIRLIIADMNINSGRIIYFTNELRSDDKYSLIPILMLTDNIGKNSWKQLKGIKDWIIKPFSADKLLNTVERLSI
ncbi:MAG: response regulator [Spirochaetales bacterium]|nr:response regulator [Spirochaetales bacterium]